jgi:hypothetical protein
VSVYDIASDVKRDFVIQGQYLRTLEWLGNQKLVAVDWNDNLWLIDITQDCNNIKLAENFSSTSLLSQISPDSDTALQFLKTVLIL